MAFEFKRSVWKVVERRDGAVFRTERLEDEWVAEGVDSHPDPDKFYGSPDKFEARRQERSHD